MNIIYCGDKGIERGVLVSVLSLIRNGRKRFDLKKGKMVFDEKIKEPEYHIFILTIRYKEVKPFSRRVAERLDELVKKENERSFVKLIDATEVFVKNLPKKNMGSYFTPASMLRLYIDKVPEIAALERVLYLDYDVVCRGNIGEFYNTEMEGIEAAGVLDIYGRIWYHYNGLLVQDYMNSGVMLFNMTECLKTRMFEKAARLCATKKMMLADQAALNKEISRRKLMPRRFNEQEERPRVDTILHHFSNNFKFWPYFRVQKVKPFEVDKIHEILKIYEYDDILEEYLKMQDDLGRG